MRALILGLNLLSATLSFATPSSSLTIKYFAANSPSIAEFKKGRATVEAVLKKITDAGLSSHPQTLEIGISPIQTKYEDIIYLEGRLYVAVKASEDALELVLSGYFHFPSSSISTVTYFPQGISVQNFLELKDRIEKALNKFDNEGLELVFPESYSIYLRSTQEKYKDINDSGNYVSISSTVDDEDLERFFSKFIDE